MSNNIISDQSYGITTSVQNTYVGGNCTLITIGKSSIAKNDTHCGNTVTSGKNKDTSSPFISSKTQSLNDETYISNHSILIKDKVVKGDLNTIVIGEGVSQELLEAVMRF